MFVCYTVPLLHCCGCTVVNVLWLCNQKACCHPLKLFSDLPFNRDPAPLRLTVHSVVVCFFVEDGEGGGGPKVTKLVSIVINCKGREVAYTICLNCSFPYSVKSH